MRGSEGRGAAPSPGSDREFPSLYHYSCHLFFLSVAPASQLAVSWCCGRVRELRGKEKRGECAFKKAFAINGIFSLSQVIFFYYSREEGTREGNLFLHLHHPLAASAAELLTTSTLIYLRLPASTGWQGLHPLLTSDNFEEKLKRPKQWVRTAAVLSILPFMKGFHSQTFSYLT